MEEGGVAGPGPPVDEAEALFGGEDIEPGVELLVEGGVVFGAEAVGLIVFVPSSGEADLSLEEIREFIEEQGYDQTVALAERVKEYVRGWEEIHPETREWLNRKSDW